MKWTIREIKQLDNGRQKRPYADHIYKWEICVEGRTEEADILPFCQEYLQHAQNEHDEYFKKYRDSNLSFEEHMRVGYGHRPDPKGYVVRSYGDGKIKVPHPQCYGKGGWNYDNVKVWLDIDCDPAISEPLKNVFKSMDNLVEDFMDACDNIVESKNKTK